MSPLTHRRVVVTGLGAVSPVGLNAGDFWASLLASRSGVRRLEFPWMRPEEFRTLIGAPVVGFDPLAAGLDARDLKVLDPACWYAIAAAREALVHAGFELVDSERGRESAWRIEGVDAERVATSIGTGMGGLTTLEAVHRQWSLHDTLRGKAWLRYGLPMLIPNAPAANVAIKFGLRGECSAEVTACAAGSVSIGSAFRLVRDGEVDLAVAGGVDALVTDHDGLGLVGFDLLRVMSTRNDDPDRASRPFDRDRDGFVLGEGAAVLVLESLDHARARGALPLAEILSFAATCDANSMMQPAADGAMVERAVRLALERAGVSPSEIGYVNAHATSTPAGDAVEAAVLRRVFGDSSDAPLVSATKSMTGHCIGASGALEALATVRSLADGVVHPTRNLEAPDDATRLNHVTGEPRRVALDLALTTSYGFGGHDAALVLRRYD